MLKLSVNLMRLLYLLQPPSGGRVLKQSTMGSVRYFKYQPPSGGCVLKPNSGPIANMEAPPAAFRRLCVETLTGYTPKIIGAQPPSGGCVLKRDLMPLIKPSIIQPPSGGCVLKRLPSLRLSHRASSAAFRRLCVETKMLPFLCRNTLQLPSGGCVLKLII